MKREDVAKKYGWRSGFEQEIAAQLETAGSIWYYEPFKLPFEQPKKIRNYTPDFVAKRKVGGNMVIESKGRFLTADRMKHLMIKASYPELDVRFVFSNAHAKISKASQTTYAKWCDQHGFQWAHKAIPVEWLEELESK